MLTLIWKKCKLCKGGGCKLLSITVKCTAYIVMLYIIWYKMSNPVSVLFPAGTYIPRKEVAVLEVIKATVIRENQAIRLRARREGLDRSGVQRVTGLWDTSPQTIIISITYLPSCCSKPVWLLSFCATYKIDFISMQWKSVANCLLLYMQT